MNDELLDRLYAAFTERGYQYRVDGELRNVSREDLSVILAMMRNSIVNEPEGTQIEIGRMVMKKRQGYFDVFLFEGEYHGTES